MTAAIAARDMERTSLDRARRALWLAVLFAFLSFGIGAGWDRAWHVTHPFEDFFSPPHLFIYANNLVATLLVAWIAFDADLRRWFGTPIPLAFGVALPGSLVLALGAFGVIALAGVMDAVWHTRFGLDETAWSFPHAMLGSGILLGVLGFLSLRLALAAHRPMAPWLPAAFALIALTTFAGVLCGPLDNNRTLGAVAAIGRIPVLANDPNYQHIVRIETAWDLTRSNPLFPPLSALAVGLGLAFARRLVREAWIFVLIAGVATLLATDRREAELFRGAVGPADWLPIPYLVPALVVASGARWERAAWFAAGLAYAIVVQSWWPSLPLSGLAAIVALPLGASLGGPVYRAVARPGRGVIALVIVSGFALPFATGLVDLALRARTP